MVFSRQILLNPGNFSMSRGNRVNKLKKEVIKKEKCPLEIFVTISSFFPKILKKVETLKTFSCFSFSTILSLQVSEAASNP
jgi:hypothetical protein